MRTTPEEASQLSVAAVQNPHSRGHTLMHAVAKAAVALVPALLGVVLALLLMQFPLATMVTLDDGGSLYAWRNGLVRTLFPLFPPAVLALSASLWLLAGRLYGGLPPRRARHAAHGLRPLAWLPLCVMMSQCPLWFGSLVSGLIIAFGPALILAWCVERLIGESLWYDKSAGARYWALHFIAYAAVILVVGLHFNGKIGEKAGDEVHYITITRSLIADGNLNLNKEMEGVIPAHNPQRAALLKHSHLVANESGDLYSYHSFGLPLLAWLPGFRSFFGRQLLLALIAGITLAGCGAACHAAGASRRASVVVAWGGGLTYACGVYAFRFLPEMLGCGLVAWSYWAILAQRRRPWSSTLAAALCCGFLPYAHTRFAPLSILLALFFGLEGLFAIRNEKLGPRLARLTGFALTYAAFGFTLFWFHRSMYSGAGAYQVGNILFSYPQAMWAVIAEHRGLLSVMTPLVWYLAAVPYALATEREHRRHGLEALAVVAVVLATACSNSAALGGHCVPGRYFLTAVPLLLPAAALVLTKSRPPARIWFYFLSCVAILFFAAALVLVKRWFFFILPLDSLRAFVGTHLIWKPLASLKEANDPSAFAQTTVFVLLLIALSLVTMIRFIHGKILVVATVVLLGGAFVTGARVNATENPSSGGTLWRMTSYWKSFRKEGGDGANLFETSRIKARLEERDPVFLLAKNVEGLGPGAKHIISKMRMSDWAGRGYRWLDLHAPVRNNVDSMIVVRVVGEVLDGTAVFAMRQGAFTLEDGLSYPEGRFDFTWIVPIRKGRGFVSGLVRLDNETGAVRLDHVYILPFSHAMGEGGLPLDPASEVRDLGK